MKNISTEVLKKQNEGVFDEFYLRYLMRAETRLKELLTESFSFSFDEESILFHAICFLKGALINLGTKVLMVELEDYKKSICGNCTYEKYIEYINTESFHAGFESKYQVLDTLLNNKVDDYCHLFEDCIRRLSADKNEIENKMNVNFSRIDKLVFDAGGDTHNGGKCVVRVDAVGGDIIYYKPHSLYMDVLFDEITSEISSKLPGYHYKHIPSIDKKEYGWQAKAEYKECQNIQDIKKYYYLIGMSLSAFYLLGTEDIHTENLIVNGDRPLYIDLEILLANKKKNFFEMPYSKTLDNELRNIYLDSVLGTYILPNTAQGGIFDIDVCALTSGQNMGKESNKMSFFGIVDAGTANIHYEKRYSECPENLSIVKYQGQIVDADEYITDIIEGFQDSYKVIRAEKDTIVKILEKQRDNKIRQIVRGTYVYVKFLDAAHHPKYMMGEDERRRVLGLIHGNGSSSPIMREIADRETEMMFRDDIPYFYTKYDSCDLYCESNDQTHVIRNTYTKSIAEILAEKLDKMSEEDMYRQIDLIYGSFANYGKHSIRKMRDQDDFFVKKLQENQADGDQRKAYIKAIYETLKRRYYECEDINTMFTLDINENNEYRINLLNANLYSGLGVVYFLALCEKLLGMDDFEGILRLVKGLERIYPFEDAQKNSSSAFNGLVGRVYVYNQLYGLTGNKEYLSLYDQILQHLMSAEIEDDEVDYVNGVSGGIVALVNIYNKNHEQKVATLLEKYQKFLHKKLTEGALENLINGMAHGYSGLILALFKLYEFSKNKLYYDKAVAFVKQENNWYSEKEQNWKDLRTGDYRSLYWCHGAAGIGLSRTATLKYVQEDQALHDIWMKDIRNCISAIKKRGVCVDNQGLCHGVMGNLIILSYLAKELNDIALRQYVEKNFQAFLDMLLTDAIHYQNPFNIVDVNFMLGLSGIGYSILKLENEDVPNVLLLEA